MELNELIKKVDALKGELDKLKLIKPEFQKKLDEKIRLEFSYNSNHLEGNTLTYGETELLLIRGKTRGNHDAREYEEMKGHDLAFTLIKEWAANKEQPLTENMIKELNQVILKEPFWKEAITPDGQATRRLIKIGGYKEYPNSVRLENGDIFEYASPTDTPIKMGELMQWYRKEENSKELPPSVLAALFHYRFVRIHPFDDGNGRVSRLLMNYVLLKNDLPPVIIKSADKRNYLSALNNADNIDINYFVEYILNQQIWSLELSIKAAKGESVEEPDDWEKELDIFKKDLKNREETNLIKSRPVLQDIYKNSIYKLFSAVESKLSKFYDLFNKVNYNYDLQNNIETTILKQPGTNLEYVENQIFFDPNNPIKYGYIGVKPKFEAEKKTIENFQYPSIQRILIAYQFKGFKKAGADPFDIYINFDVVLDELTYTIRCSDIKMKDIKKTYKQYLTDDECEEIALKTAKTMLNNIKKYSGAQ